MSRGARSSSTNIRARSHACSRSGPRLLFVIQSSSRQLLNREAAEGEPEGSTRKPAEPDSTAACGRSKEQHLGEI
ncbi:hypothetical protein ATANTOWER_001748 [Ataeniobius toweri]|uniref:Uncharacterized protein n=1 Tax=Ataeniobius toweri TaxID=208326 RepID=A0ABU7BM49_9TELE|nr:hypothetical protein [Ataeniobius toweri]